MRRPTIPGPQAPKKKKKSQKKKKKKVPKKHALLLEIEFKPFKFGFRVQGFIVQGLMFRFVGDGRLKLLKQGLKPKVCAFTAEQNERTRKRMPFSV